MIKSKVTKILISAGIVASVIGVAPVMLANAQPISKSQNYNVDSSNSSMQKVVVNTRVQLSNGTANKYDMAVITGEKGNDYTIITQSGIIGTIVKSNVTVVKSGKENQLVKLNETEHVINVTTDLNVREQPEVQSGLLTTIRNGSAIQVIGKEGEWFKVSINGQIGYVYNEFIGENTGVVSSTENTTTANQESTQNNSNSKSQQVKASNIAATKTNTSEIINYKTPEYVFINIQNGSVNIRNGAGTGNAVIGKLTNNEALKILAKEGNWYKVSTGNQIGWIDGESVNFTKANTTPVTTVIKDGSNKTETKDKTQPKEATSKAQPKEVSNEIALKDTSNKIGVKDTDNKIESKDVNNQANNESKETKVNFVAKDKTNTNSRVNKDTTSK